MKATILCSFDDVDLADLAAGKLRARMEKGIESIEISKPYYGEPSDTMDFLPIFPTMNGNFGAVTYPVGLTAIPTIEEQSSPDSPESDYIPRSVTLRVTCAPEQRSDIESILINLGAQKIRSMNDGH
ncbi:hypothetical protein DW086_06050 [Harryflintia acetispora]|nr:hypothetical protein DW086_06050 [Harryflintia acetispora]